MQTAVEWLCTNALVIIRLELWTELAISTFCFICNVYFAARFAELQTIDPSLRLVMVVAHLIKANLSILHSILQMIPEQSYSLANQQYFNAFVFYSLQLLIEIFVFLTGAEFAIVMIERRQAVLNFNRMGENDCRLGKRIIFVSFGLTTFGILTKAFCVVFFTDSSVPLQERLESALMVERSPGSLIFLHIYAAASVLYGLFEFFHLNRHVQKRWFDAETLNERYQIKQTGAVLQVLKPMAVAYFVCLVTTFFGLSFTLHSYYVLGYSLRSARYLLFNYTEYLSLAVYNLFSTSYMIWYFKPLKRLMLQDLGTICRQKTRTAQIEPNRIDWDREREFHFEYLSRAWQQNLK